MDAINVNLPVTLWEELGGQQTLVRHDSSQTMEHKLKVYLQALEKSKIKCFFA